MNKIVIITLLFLCFALAEAQLFVPENLTVSQTSESSNLLSWDAPITPFDGMDDF